MVLYYGVGKGSAGNWIIGAETPTNITVLGINMILKIVIAKNERVRLIRMNTLLLVTCLIPTNHVASRYK